MTKVFPEAYFSIIFEGIFGESGIFRRVRGSHRGAPAPLKTNFPLPLVKGKGIKGMGFNK
jgi:hypothetical protein